MLSPGVISFELVRPSDRAGSLLRIMLRVGARVEAQDLGALRLTGSFHVGPVIFLMAAVLFLVRVAWPSSTQCRTATYSSTTRSPGRMDRRADSSDPATSYLYAWDWGKNQTRQQLRSRPSMIPDALARRDHDLSRVRRSRWYHITSQRTPTSPTWCGPRTRP